MERFRGSHRRQFFSGRTVARLVLALMACIVYAGSALSETLSVSNQTSSPIGVKVIKGSGSCTPQEVTFKAQKRGTIALNGCSIGEVCVLGSGVSATQLGLVDISAIGSQCTLTANGSNRPKDAGPCSDGRATAFHWQNLGGSASGSSTLTCTQ